jgi:feruloyl-CoA synthase
VFLSPVAKQLAPQEIRARLSKVLKKMPGTSSTRPARLLVMSEPPSIDANEITDKGYMNQRAVLERRAALVEKLYRDDPEVIR